MVTSRFSNPGAADPSIEALRTHAEEARKIEKVMTISKERSKLIARRTRDAIVAAFKEEHQ